MCGVRQEGSGEISCLNCTFFRHRATLSLMLTYFSDTDERSLTLECRNCREPNTFSIAYLWRTGAIALKCSNRSCANRFCFSDKDRKRAYMFAVRHMVAVHERERIEENRRRREERQFNRPVGPKQRFDILRRDKFTCQYCGRSAPDVELHVDHIIPRAKGGLRVRTH